MPEIDFQTATEAGLEGVPDENVLAIAARENRILINPRLQNDAETFCRVH